MFGWYSIVPNNFWVEKNLESKLKSIESKLKSIESKLTSIKHKYISKKIVEGGRKKNCQLFSRLKLFRGGGGGPHTNQTPTLMNLSLDERSLVGEKFGKCKFDTGKFERDTFNSDAFERDKPDRDKKG